MRGYAITAAADEPAAALWRSRSPTYSSEAIEVLERISKAADYPWLERLKAMLPLWLPWARKQIPGCTAEMESKL